MNGSRTIDRKRRGRIVRHQTSHTKIHCKSRLSIGKSRYWKTLKMTLVKDSLMTQCEITGSTGAEMLLTKEGWEAFRYPRVFQRRCSVQTVASHG